MKRLTMLGSLIGALGLAVGCGDNHQVCGEGTHEDNGVCLPDGTGATCGQGTVMDTAGECVPSDEVCAEGTVFIEGVCVPEDDTLTADLEEEAEPNDGFEKTDDVAGSIALDAVGDGTSFHGCITPYRDLDANGNDDIDYDMWLVTVEEASLIDVTADGVHGLSAGFFWIPASATTQALIDADWFRYGINLATDTSSRQVYLPFPGTYALVMSDSRSLFLSDGGAGQNDETCYYTSIEKVAIPTPTAVTADVAVNGTIGGDTLFYSYNPPEGDLVEVLHGIDSAAASPSVVGLRNAAFRAYGEGDDEGQVDMLFGGMVDADNILLVVEPVYNYAQTPVAYDLTVHPLATVALPTAGTTAGRSNLSEEPTWQTLDDVTWMWFDVGSGEVVHFDMSFEEGDDCKGPCAFPLNLAFLDQDLNFVGDSLAGDFFFGGSYVDSFDGWVRFPAAGRYYVGFFPPLLNAGETFDVTSTVTRVVPGAAAINTPIVNAPFNAMGRTWHDLDGGTSLWAGVDAAATSWGADVSLDFYDAAAVGVLDLDIPADPFLDVPSDGSADGFLGRILFGQPNDFLISVRDFEGIADATSTYDLSIADRDFTNLGTVTAAAPIDLATEVSTFIGDPPSGALYFARVTPGNLLTITVTPVADDIGVDLLDRDEGFVDFADSGGAGVAESMFVVAPADGFVALRIYNFDAADVNDHSFQLEIVAAPPTPYVATTGALAFTDACADEVLAVDAGDLDEGALFDQALPFDFSMFGHPPGNTYDISTNGFIAFEPLSSAHFNNVAMPTAGTPNAVVAAYWDDLDLFSLCRASTATTVTIQWTGITFDSSLFVELQAVIHDSGVVDFIYGPLHEASGSKGTVGIEAPGGTVAHQLVFDTPGAILPSTSRTLTPTP